MLTKVVKEPGQERDIFDDLQEEIDVFSARKRARFAEALKNGEPIVGGVCQFTPEVFVALDLAAWFTAVFHLQAVGSEKAPEFIDVSTERLGTNFFCSLIRTGIYQLEAGLFPTPTMLVGGSSPCDANVTLAQIMFSHKPWAKIPKFAVDVPYKKDDQSIQYLAKQIRELISFIEKHSGRKLDWNRLKEICEESNKALRYMLEFSELKRAVPSPVSWPWGTNAYTVGRIFATGTPEGVDWNRRLVEATEKRVKEKKGIDGVTEKIRLLWFDVLPVWGYKLFPRLEKEFGAVIIMDMYAYNPPFTLIDTSSEEAMCKSFATLYAAETPMARQALATMDVYSGDVVRIVKDYKIDAVILPTHTGHKDVNTVVKIMNDLCRDIGVPFLSIGCDMFDDRYMSADEVLDKMVRFFQVSELA